MLPRLVFTLYLITLALLPWSWFPPFPWLHEHAQWSDAVFAITALAWIIEQWQAGRWLRPRAVHAALACYFGAATLSLLLAASDKWAGAWKLLGIAELCVLVLITSDLAARPGKLRVIARVVALTSLITALAAVIGLLLFYAGVSTRLIGSYGDLVSSTWYARVQAGTYHPNLLASYCIFAASVIAHDEAKLPVKLRHAIAVALWITVGLTFSRGILAFGLAALMRSARTKQRRVLTSLYATASVVIIAALTFWNLSLNPAHPFEASFEHNIASSRWQAITTSLQTLFAHPLWGSGLGTSPGTYHGVPFDAHLTPLNIAATLGLPALAAFLSLLVILWRQRSRPLDLAIWSSFAGLALDALAQDVEDFRHLWVFIGLADATSRPMPVSEADSSKVLQ